MKSYMNIGDYTIDTSAFELSENGVTIFDNNGNPIIHYKNHEFIGDFLQPPRQIKVVFDNGGMQMTDESDHDYTEDYEAATDEEIEALIGID